MSGEREARRRPGDPPRPGHARPRVSLRVHHELDLDELDPRGRARRRAERAAAPRPRKRSRRRRALKYTALCAAGVVLGVAAAGFYLVHHLFGRVDTVSLSRLTDRPSSARPNAAGETPLNILVLGSQTRDGQHGVNLGNATKDGTACPTPCSWCTSRPTGAGRRSSPYRATLRSPGRTARAASIRP